MGVGVVVVSGIVIMGEVVVVMSVVVALCLAAGVVTDGAAPSFLAASLTGPPPGSSPGVLPPVRTPGAVTTRFRTTTTPADGSF